MAGVRGVTDGGRREGFGAGGGAEVGVGVAVAVEAVTTDEAPSRMVSETPELDGRKTDDIEIGDIETDGRKTDDIEIGDIETDRRKTDEIKTDEIKTDEIKTDEIKTDEIKTDEIKTDEIKTDEIKTDDIKTDEIKTDDIKTDEIKTDETKTDEIKTDEAKTDEIKTDETKTDSTHAKQEEAKAALPKLSASEFRQYNRLAERMEYFHSNFRRSWTMLYTACSERARPPGLTIRGFIGLGLDFCHHLTMHHSIEERHVFPVLATRMPAFGAELELLTQHKMIHVGLEKLERYLEACRDGERELRLDEVAVLMDGFGHTLWTHLDEEVAELGAENMRTYWRLDEIARLPM